MKAVGEKIGCGSDMAVKTLYIPSPKLPSVDPPSSLSSLDIPERYSSSESMVMMPTMIDDNDVTASVCRRLCLPNVKSSRPVAASPFTGLKGVRQSSGRGKVGGDDGHHKPTWSEVDDTRVQPRKAGDTCNGRDTVCTGKAEGRICTVEGC